MARRLGALAWIAAACASVAAAQTTGTIGLGATYVEYDGFLAAGAAILQPAVHFNSPTLSFGGQSSWTLFETGNSVFQGTLAAAWLPPSSSAWRFEVQGSGGWSQYSLGDASAHLLGGARLHRLGRSSGAWLGAGAGTSARGRSGVPIALSMTGWAVTNRLGLVGSVTGTLHSQVRHLDVQGAVRWNAAPVELEARLGIRPWARDTVGAEVFSGVFGELSVVVALGERLGLSVAGGRYPPDPVRGALGAAYVSAGLRLRTFGRASLPVPIAATSVLHGRRIPTEESGPALDVLGSAERRVLRLRAAGATSVELMGDFTDWTPVALIQTEPGVWVARQPLPAGMYRVNVRVDGGAWGVPRGLRVERTDFGGMVGIVVVP